MWGSGFGPGIVRSGRDSNVSSGSGSYLIGETIKRIGLRIKRALRLEVVRQRKKLTQSHHKWLAPTQATLLTALPSRQYRWIGGPVVYQVRVRDGRCILQEGKQIVPYTFVFIKFLAYLSVMRVVWLEAKLCFGRNETLSLSLIRNGIQLEGMDHNLLLTFTGMLTLCLICSAIDH